MGNTITPVAYQHPPVVPAARVPAPLDQVFARYTTIGAASIAVAARRLDLGSRP